MNKILRVFKIMRDNAELRKKLLHMQGQLVGSINRHVALGVELSRKEEEVKVLRKVVSDYQKKEQKRNDKV
jgi:hypothetical protein